MHRLPLALVLAVLVPAMAGAQNHRSLAIGGFLGLLDGFCELPGGAYDAEDIKSFQGCANETGKVQPFTSQATMGGLLGASDWIKAHREGRLVLIQGNNQVANFTFLNEAVINLAGAANEVQPADFANRTTRPDQSALRLQRFWDYMTNLNADAIGMGPEDFVRSLRDPRNDPSQATVKNRGSILYRWIKRITKDGKGLPLIASNAVVKYRRENLNIVEQGEYSLSGIEEGESAPWLSALTVKHPKAEGILLELLEEGTADPIASEVTKIDNETRQIPTSTTLTPVTGGLRPDHLYTMKAIVSGTMVATLTFRTHLALTPRDSNDANLGGFPVITKPFIGSHELLVSLVSPSVKALLGKEAWKWDVAPCPGEECEIDFMSPTDAMKTIVGRASAGMTQQPIVSLISALDDTETTATLNAFTEIRTVVLPQESLIIGRASREAAGKFSGDLGMSAVLNPEKPLVTSIVVRPEWLGETGALIDAMITPEHNTWKAERATISVKPVAGAALQWSAVQCSADILKQNPNATCTNFWMEWPTLNSTRIPYGIFQNYLACDTDETKRSPPSTDQCAMFNELIHHSFDAFAGDALRRATGAELAIVPGSLIDDDFADWIESVVDSTHTRVMTRLVLERALYRSFRIVRASVSGDQLPATLDKAIKAESQEGPCVVGLGEPCATSVDKDHPDKLIVNGRILDPRLYYSIAMPEGLAEELELDHSEGERHTTDAVSAIHERLAGTGGAGWYIEDTADSLGERIVSRGDRKLQRNYIASSLEYAYTNLNVHEGTVALKQTNIDFRSVTPARTSQWKADLDVIALDTTSLAARAIANFDYKQRTEPTDKGDKVSLDSNIATLGVRGDYKLPLTRDVRAYVGYFYEGEVARSTESITATLSEKTEDGSTKTRQADSATALTKKPLRYQYTAFGIDSINSFNFFSDARVPLNITKMSFQYALGMLMNSPNGFAVDGAPLDDPALKDKGAQEVLDAIFLAHRTDFDPKLRFEQLYADRHQQRAQFEINFEPTTKVLDKTWKFGTEFRVRLYPTVADSQPNSVSQSIRLKFSWSIPVYRRLEIVPAWEKQWAWIHAENSGMYRHTDFQINLKVPFVLRADWGWMLR